MDGGRIAKETVYSTVLSQSQTRHPGRLRMTRPRYTRTPKSLRAARGTPSRQKSQKPLRDRELPFFGVKCLTDKFFVGCSRIPKMSVAANISVAGLDYLGQQYNPDHELVFDVCVAVALAAIYIVVSTFIYPSEKERAWIISVSLVFSQVLSTFSDDRRLEFQGFSSTLCSVVGLYCCHYELKWEFLQLPWSQSIPFDETRTTRFVVRFFRVSNVTDIVIGLLRYPSMVIFDILRHHEPTFSHAFPRSRSCTSSQHGFTMERMYSSAAGC